MKKNIAITIVSIAAAIMLASCSGLGSALLTSSSSDNLSGSITARTGLTWNSGAAISAGTYDVYIGQYDPTSSSLLTTNPSAATTYAPSAIFTAGTWKKYSITYDPDNGFVGAPSFKTAFSIPGLLTMVGFIDVNGDGQLSFGTSGSLEPMGTMGNDGGTHSDTITSWQVNQSVGAVGVQF